jgi:hypothetical protein
VTVAAEDAQARRDARWARYQARSRRSAQKFQLALVPLWVASAVFWWFNPGSDLLVRERKKPRVADPGLLFLWAILGSNQ